MKDRLLNFIGDMIELGFWLFVLSVIFAAGASRAFGI